MTINFASMLVDVMPELPGASTDIAVAALRKAAQEFCSKSLYVRDKVTPNITSGDATYTVTPTDNTTRVEKILSVRLDGDEDPLAPCAVDDTGEQGMVTGFAVTAIDEITLVKIPDADHTSLIRFAVTPKDDAVGMPDALARFRDDIARGAMARLMFQPRKPWSNLQVGAEYVSVFKSAVSAAAIIAEKQFGTLPMRTRTVSDID